MTPYLPLENKVALITGGTSGIGAAIVELFLKSGAIVHFFGTNPEKKEALIQKLKSEHPELASRIFGYICNVTNHQEVDALIQSIVADHQKIDILINSAGITRDTLILRMTPDQWNDVINTNLTSVFNLCQIVSKLMLKAKKGTIVNISSVIGLIGNAGQTNYAAAKAGLIGFSKSLARELASRSIRVNVIAPGFIDTPMTQSLDSTLQSKVKEGIPLGRFGSSHEIAQVALFLASDNASYITGQTLAVDGGMTML